MPDHKFKIGQTVYVERTLVMPGSVRGLMLRTNAAWFNCPARRLGRTLAKRRRCPTLVRAARHASS